MKQSFNVSCTCSNYTEDLLLDKCGHALLDIVVHSCNFGASGDRRITDAGESQRQDNHNLTRP